MTATKPPETFVLLSDELMDLVADGKLSRDAAWLYVALLRHHNRKRDDDDVWPSRTSLARALGMKKPDSVDGYMSELKKLGLVTVAERRVAGMRARNRYTLNLIVAPRTPEQGATTRPAKTRVSAAQSDTPNPGVRYPETGVPVTPNSGYELDEEELHQEQLETPASLSGGHEATVAASSVTAPQPREREAKFSNQDRRTLPQRLVAKRGWNDADTAEIVETIESTNYIEGNGWWVTADKNGSLDEAIKEAVKSIRDYQEYLASEATKAPRLPSSDPPGDDPFADPWAAWKPQSAA